ncbi:MAG: T9SS type A sorting domain-containing protein [Chitinophagales bacterium]|nr:T9SS type A sorting domain-containing protein [Chitinophagales bacterium]
MITRINFQSIKVMAAGFIFVFGAGIVSAQTTVKVTLLDNSEQNYAVVPDGKLWFDQGQFVINKDHDAAPITIPISTIRKITFGGDGDTSSVHELANDKTDIHIFPNPANDYFELKTAVSEKLLVRIYNTNGVLVASNTFANGDRVDISQLSLGIYVVVINNQSFKLIKQ